jgi:transposase-like protein
MPAGRPSKYSEAYCNEVIDCLSEGHSVTAFAGRIGVARSTVFKWAEEHQEFSDALKIGQAKATEFWENILANVAREGKGNATAAIFGLKNRAGEDWADKVVNEHSGPDGGPISIKTIERVVVDPKAQD